MDYLLPLSYSYLNISDCSMLSISKESRDMSKFSSFSISEQPLSICEKLKLLSFRFIGELASSSYRPSFSSSSYYSTLSCFEIALYTP